MKRKNSEFLGDVLRQFLRSEGLETPLNEYRLKEAYPEVVGPAISKLSSDLQIRNSILYVKISRPALRQDLMMGRTELTRRLNEKVGAQVIQTIVFH